MCHSLIAIVYGDLDLCSTSSPGEIVLHCQHEQPLCGADDLIAGPDPQDLHNALNLILGLGAGFFGGVILQRKEAGNLGVLS